MYIYGYKIELESFDDVLRKKRIPYQWQIYGKGPGGTSPSFTPPPLLL